MLYFVSFICKINVLSQTLLIGLLSTSAYAACPAYERIQEQKSCRTSSETNLQTDLVKELARKSTSYQKSGLSNSFFMHLQQESLQKVEALSQDKEFQQSVVELKAPLQTSLSYSELADSKLKRTSQDNLYIFISFSMDEKALLNMAHEAKRFGAIMVLRGFKEGSYLKTAHALQEIITKTGQGILVDPELYSLFNITAVPTFVFARPFNLSALERTQTPIHDKLQGHVSVHYALETFAKEGDLKEESLSLLHRGVLP